MKRRDLIVGAAGALAALAMTGQAQAQAHRDGWMPGWLSRMVRRSFREWRRGGHITHIAPGGAGARDGGSWEDAAPIEALEAMIDAAGPGGEVRIAADLGPYRDVEAIVLRAGGLADRPVLVHGVNRAGAPAAALLVGRRAPVFTPEAAKGEDALRLLSGADHLRFRNLAFRHVGNGCFRIGGAVSDLVIEDCSFENVYRFIENTASGDARDATITAFAVRRCSGSLIERSFARIRYRSAQGLIEDCRADSRGLEGDSFAVGIALDDQAHDIALVRCTMENFRQSNGTRYWNGDGFSDEGGNRAIRYQDCVARGSTDGGFDCKSEGLVMENCLAEDNKRNFRVWSRQARLVNCTSRSPNWRGRGQENGGPAHVWVGGREGKRITLEGFAAEATDATPVFVTDTDRALIEVRGRRFALPEGTPLEEREGGDGVEIRLG